MEEHKLLKFLNGSASPQEEYEVSQWLKQPESRREFDSLLEKYYENPSPRFSDNTDYNQLLGVIHKKILKPKEVKKQSGKTLIFKSLRIAASIILILFSGYVLFESFQYEDNSKSEINEGLISTTSRTTGPGEKLTLMMPDKSRVTVNALSEISFTSDYGKTDRVIHVTGEAFFEVASDPSKPFKVISDGITTTALGTEFNVYSRNDEYKIALVEGKVAVEKVDHQIELLPGLMALWNAEKKESKNFSVESFEVEKLTAWKEGELLFERKPFGEIINDLETWYSVEIHLDKEIDTNKKVIGAFQNKNLNDILTGLSFSLDFAFEIDGNKVQIKKTNL